jgi:hypothetical protein
MANAKVKDEFDLEEINEDKESKATKLFKKILWYAGAIIVVILAIGGSIQFLVKKGIDKNASTEKLEIIINTQLAQKKLSDSILVNVKEIKELVKENTETVEGLSNSYVLFMQNNKSLSKDDFRNYMEGVTWESKKKAVTEPIEVKEDTSKYRGHIIVNKLDKK